MDTGVLINCSRYLVDGVGAALLVLLVEEEVELPARDMMTLGRNQASTVRRMR